jgi:positive regulator of sigma E activity
MIFPFSIKCSRKLKEKVSIEDSKIVMAYIQKFIESKTCESIVINENQLSYKTGSFRNKWNSDILTDVEKGKFELINNENESILTYEFFMYNLLLSTLLISILIGMISSEIYIAIFLFALLGFGNWIIIIIRHRLMLKEIVTEIETLIKEKHNN